MPLLSKWETIAPVSASKDNDRQGHLAYSNPTGNGSDKPLTVADDLKNKNYAV